MTTRTGEVHDIFILKRTEIENLSPVETKFLFFNTPLRYPLDYDASLITIKNTIELELNDKIKTNKDEVGMKLRL